MKNRIAKHEEKNSKKTASGLPESTAALRRLGFLLGGRPDCLISVAASIYCCRFAIARLLVIKAGSGRCLLGSREVVAGFDYVALQSYKRKPVVALTRN